MEKEQVISFDEFRTKLSRREPFDGYVKDVGRASTMFSLYGMIQYLDVTPELNKAKWAAFSAMGEQLNNQGNQSNNKNSKGNTPGFSIAQQDATRVDMKDKYVEIQEHISNIEKQKVASIIEKQLDNLQRIMEFQHELDKIREKMGRASNNMAATSQVCQKNYPNVSEDPSYNSIPSNINKFNGAASIPISSKDLNIKGSKIKVIKANPIPKGGMFVGDQLGNLSHMDEDAIAKLRKSQIKNIKNEVTPYTKLSRGSMVFSLVLIGADVIINGEAKLSHVIDAVLSIGFYFLSSNPIGLGIVAIYIVADIALSLITDKSLTQHIMEGVGIEDKTLLKAKEKPKHVPRYNGYDQYQSELRPAPYPSYRRR